MTNTIQFGPEISADLSRGFGREWLETNGIGGFASASITGANTRRYHGLLVAATRPPVGRMVLLSKLEETLTVGKARFELSTNQYPGAVHPRGYEHQVGFRLDPFPVFEYLVEGAKVEKSVFLVHGENTVVIQYTLGPGASSVQLELDPLIAFRDYHGLTHVNEALRGGYVNSSGMLMILPYDGVPALYLSYGAAEVAATGHWYRNFEYVREQERGLDFHEDLFNPCRLRYTLAPGETVSLVASTEPRSQRQAEVLRSAEVSRRRAISASAPVHNALVRRLVTAADQFIVDRGDGKTVIAGYHWFSDWGRDTMIALPGLTLVTGRIEVARQILLEFVKHLDRGMLPNRFPDAGEAPEYNTVDATLWLFEAVRSFAEYSGDRQWVIDNIYPALKSIIDWHLRGTRYNIHVDSDGLLWAGEPGAQLTWMDAKIGDWVVTPRHGKPVEIQALWYNALRVLFDFATEAGEADTALFVDELSMLVRKKFRHKFWNAESRCLYDVVNGDITDASIRPNQIFAVSLHYTMLTLSEAQDVVRTVEQHLLTPLGLRSLSTADPAYRPRYEGDVQSRDSAYHQGTVWLWLMGPFITAWLSVHGRTPATLRRTESWLSGIEQAMIDAGLGQLSEIADGEAPHAQQGCIAQAWSIAEILRAAVEDVWKVTPARTLIASTAE